MYERLTTIESTCGNCPNLPVCEFGKPALTIEATRRHTPEASSSAIVFVWESRKLNVIPICPKPDQVKTVITFLKENQ